MRIVLIGPPGAGKGTQAQTLSSDLAIPHISTGDLFRHHASNQTALGRAAQGYLDAGELVPDTVTNDMVRQRLAELDTHTGFLLDGFPRTLAQADVLSAILAESGHKLDAVFEFSVPDDELLRRLLARGRGDDTADVIRHRLQVYRTQTAPLLAHYRRIVATINAVGPIHDITARAHRALRAIA